MKIIDRADEDNNNVESQRMKLIDKNQAPSIVLVNKDECNAVPSKKPDNDVKE